MATGALIGASLIGGGLSYMGSRKQAGAINNAAQQQAAATLEAQKRAQAFQEMMTQKATGYLTPYTDQFASPDILGQFSNFAQGGVGADILEQMNQLAQNGINTNYQADPAYQWRQAQQEEALNRQLAERGLYGSSVGLGTLSDAQMALSGQEADKQYLRGVDEYNRQYGNLTNQYNYNYGNLLDQINLGYNANQALAGITANTGANIGNQILTSGLSSAQNTAALQAQAGTVLGQGYAGLGSSLGDAVSTYAVAPALNDILKGFTNQDQNPYAGGLGWGLKPAGSAKQYSTNPWNFGQASPQAPR